MGPLPYKLRSSVRRVGPALAALCCALAGCTAMTNPAADGIPVRLLPPELIGPSKTCWQTIPLSALEQPPAEVYRLAAGDVLGVYIEGYLGERTTPLPVQAAPAVVMREQYRLPPAAGYPISVQEDGTIALPSVPRLKVDGMTVGEARDAIRDLYVKKEQLIKPNNERILVTLLYPRQSQVLVFRQEATSFSTATDGPVPTGKRNTGFTVDLPAYENDVLHALARTGGLPDLDAYNEIIIYRDYLRDKNIKVELKQFEKGKPRELAVGETLRIPLRLPAGAPLPFGPGDIALHTGDVVFLEARDEQVFFTAGLLPPGKHMLPRDHDLDVLEAVAMVHGPLYNGAWGGSNLSGQLIEPGLGSPSPSLLVVVRRVPGRGQVPIAVDLRSAFQHPQERIPIRPGDVLLLQEKPAEAFARYVTQTFLNFEMMLNVFNSNNAFGVLDVAGPDRLSTRPALFNTVLP